MRPLILVLLVFTLPLALAADQPERRSMDHEISDILMASPAFSGPELGEVLKRTVTITMERASSEALTEELSAMVGAPLVFVARDPAEAMALDVEDLNTGDMIRALSALGVAATASGGKIYLNAHDVSAQDLAAVLTPLLGTQVALEPTIAGDRFSVEIDALPLETALHVLSRFGTIHLE